MKNGMVNEVLRKVEDNLPTILTGVGVVTGLITVGYSIFAGWKIKEVVSNEELDKKQKTKEVVKMAVPIVAGTAVTITCHIAAHKKSMSKLAGAMALYGATKIDADNFKEEVSKILGKEKVNEIEKDIHKQKIVEPSVPANCKVKIRDDVTGYSFETTMSDFWAAVNKVNEDAQSDAVSIAQFYEELLGKNYTFADIHERITFGYDTCITSLRPEFSAAMEDDMSLSYCISYPYNEA